MNRREMRQRIRALEAEVKALRKQVTALQVERSLPPLPTSREVVIWPGPPPWPVTSDRPQPFNPFEITCTSYECNSRPHGVIARWEATPAPGDNHRAVN